MVQGDTTTAMTTALSAFYRKVPVDHVEAGLRSGDIHSPWPEELNRKIDRLAAFRAPHPRAFGGLPDGRKYRANRVFVTGNTVIDALLDIKQRIDRVAWVHGAMDGRW